MKNIKRGIGILLFFLILTSLSLFADSPTFTSKINNVSGGYSGFGLNLFPVGTNFGYELYFPLFKEYKHKTKVYLGSGFWAGSGWLDRDYDYVSGAPTWSKKKYEQSEMMLFPSGQYFHPRSEIYAYLEQPIGTNPVDKTGPLLELRLTLATFYSECLEPLSSSFSGTNFTFVDSSGCPKTPFALDVFFPAFPWLSDNRKSFNNYISIDSYWYFRRWIAHNAYDGIYMELGFRTGPSWFFNKSNSSNNVLSDYSRSYCYLEETFVLFALKQDNGWNWMNLVAGHSNSLSYTDGDVTPWYALSGYRMRGYFGDRIWLRLNGPQFLTTDCYTYAELSINNHLYFGHVENEASQVTEGVSYNSSFDIYLHLRMFGFIKFEYSAGYSYANGINGGYSYWHQGGQVTFSVTL